MIRIIHFILGLGFLTWFAALYIKGIFAIHWPFIYWPFAIPWALCLVLYLLCRYAFKANIGEKAKRKPRVKKYV